MSLCGTQRRSVCLGRERALESSRDIKRYHTSPHLTSPPLLFSSLSVHYLIPHIYPSTGLGPPSTSTHHSPPPRSPSYLPTYLPTRYVSSLGATIRRPTPASSPLVLHPRRRHLTTLSTNGLPPLGNPSRHFFHLLAASSSVLPHLAALRCFPPPQRLYLVRDACPAYPPACRHPPCSRPLVSGPRFFPASCLLLAAPPSLGLVLPSLNSPPIDRPRGAMAR
jgi:hypothetical protein